MLTWNEMFVAAGGILVLSFCDKPAAGDSQILYKPSAKN